MQTNDRKYAFITGAASGMGRETARLFAGHGWFVAACDIDRAGLDSLASELGADNCYTRYLDVTDRADYASTLVEFAGLSGGRLDLLYNNAGIGRFGHFDEQEFDEIRRIIDINLVGVINGIHLAAPLLKATPNALCFTTSSSSATFGMPGIAVYSATKHAVKGLTEALSIEFARFGVRVADTLPGLIDTPLLPAAWKQGAPAEGMFRLVPARAVAEAVWAAYHDGEGRLHWFVPEEIGELDRASALDPEGTRRQLMAQGVGGTAYGEAG